MNRPAASLRGGGVTFTVVEPTHLKNMSQNWNLPQIGVKIKHIWNHHLDFFRGEITQGPRHASGQNKSAKSLNHIGSPYLRFFLKMMVNVGEYAIHGCIGINPKPECFGHFFGMIPLLNYHRGDFARRFGCFNLPPCLLCHWWFSLYNITRCPVMVGPY